jgi:ribonuclease D
VDSGPQATGELKKALAAAASPILIESTEQLAGAVEQFKGQRVLGLDTEFVRERTYRADLGLIQISDGQSCWLIDPLAISDLKPLAKFLSGSETVKVIHSGSEDFEVLFHQLGAVPDAIVDSQIACAMLGQSLQMGYHHAVDWVFGIEIDKDHTRSNWLRPLRSGQLRYAALEVVLLPEMMRQLRPRLEGLGRWTWLIEDVNRVARNSMRDVEPDAAWRRVGGAGSMDDMERRSLARLAAWRERTALEKNIARGFVVSDAGLLAMARQKPGSIAELADLQELHPKAVERYGRKWLAELKAAGSMPAVSPIPQLTGKQRKWLKAMRASVAKAAENLGVEAALLASRKQLERVIFSYAQSGTVPERFTGWRKDIVTDDLLRIMQE